MTESPRNIINRKQLILDLEGAKNPQLLFKAALARGEKEIYERFQQRLAGHESVVLRSYLVDQILRTLYDYIFNNQDNLALIAVGGYGRKELAPYSDIDILFLSQNDLSKNTQKNISKFLHFLWDLSFKVGHAARTINDTIEQAIADSVIYTGLLDARYVWGDRDLLEQFKQESSTAFTEQHKANFFEAKLQEREIRHQKYGDSRYVVEPNVKEGLGGLRDLQSLAWIVKCLFEINNFAELVSKEFITEKEKNKFIRAYNFLWSVRCHIHYVTKRPEDRLTFNLQPQLSTRMNYTDRSHTKGVERFMKHFHYMAKEITHLTQTLITAIKAEFDKKKHIGVDQALLKRLPQNYTLQDNCLMVEDKNQFIDNPSNLIEVFYIAQQENIILHPLLTHIVRRNVLKIDSDFRIQATANHIFMNIMLTPKNVESALRAMSESGVLSRFIPDFARVIAQMQFDMYHVYTVDEHTIFALGILNRLEQGLLNEEFTIPSDIVKRIDNRKVLYISVFLHDIAKGRRGDHSVVGAEVANELCPRLGLTQDETAEVAWLVLYHLLMSHTAFKRDLNDEKTIIDFVAKVQTSERLRHLYVLTVVDIRAVGPNVWNDWKAGILEELYFKAEDRITGSVTDKNSADRNDYAKAQLKKKLNHWPATVADSYIHNIRKEYWLTFDEAEQIKHAEMVLGADQQQQDFVASFWIDAAKDATMITVYAQDRSGLFSNLAGTFAAMGANIVEARIFTMHNGRALDVFWVHNFHGKPFHNKQKLEKIGDLIKAVYDEKINLHDEIVKRQTSYLKKSQHFNVSPQIYVDNNVSHTHTVIEVVCSDRPGILYEMTRLLNENKLQISNAKISTYGEKVVDVFYVKDMYGIKIENEKLIKDLKHKLINALQELKCDYTAGKR
jgi:[protein-PII] uridylyltransferase